MADTRKTDRRTVYTKKAIGDAFLRAKRNKDYNTITVADICREAEISRGTFYAHSSNANQGLKAREGGRKTAQKSRECKYVANKSHNTLLRCLRQ